MKEIQVSDTTEFKVQCEVCKTDFSADKNNNLLAIEEKHSIGTGNEMRNWTNSHWWSTRASYDWVSHYKDYITYYAKCPNCSYETYLGQTLTGEHDETEHCTSSGLVAGWD